MGVLLLLVLAVVRAAYSESAGVSAASSWRATEGPTPVVATSSEGAVKHARGESAAFTVQTAWSSNDYVLTSMAPLPDGRHVAVADKTKHIILKIELPLNATSAVTVLAGKNGSKGWQDGRGKGALFNTPTHLADDCRGTSLWWIRATATCASSPHRFLFLIHAPPAPLPPLLSACLPGDVTTIRSSSASHVASSQSPFMHSTHAPATTSTTLPPNHPLRALLARTLHSGNAPVEPTQKPSHMQHSGDESPSAPPHGSVSEDQPLHFHSKPHHPDPVKLGSGVSGMWYNASSGVLYVVETGSHRIAAFAPAPAAVAGNAAGYVAVTMEAAAGAGATGSGVSFGDAIGIPGCLCNAKNSSGGGGGQDAPSSSPWHATWRDGEVAGGAFAAGVLCAHGKPLLTAAAAGTSHLNHHPSLFSSPLLSSPPPHSPPPSVSVIQLGSALSLVIHRIASTALAVLLLLFSLPTRFMQQPLSTEPDNTSSSSSSSSGGTSTAQGPLVLHASTQQQGGGGGQREEEGGIPPKATLLSFVWPLNSSSASREAPAAAEENEESGLLISFSDKEDAVGGGKADASPSITSQHAPGAPLDILQLQSSAEMPVSIAAAAGAVCGATGSSVDSTARVMTGKEFDRAVASGDAAAAAASAAGSTAGATLGSKRDGTAASSFAAGQSLPTVTGSAPADAFSDLVGKWAGGAHLGEGEKRDTRRDVSS
ncbi:unnamed protein product [Closterium sp. Naga37s-1]|nr:unnamed protein product [Closterium sp. Naga37s-1]